jgi:hypothetical protein
VRGFLQLAMVARQCSDRFLGGRFVSEPEHNAGLDGFTPAVVRHADHGGCVANADAG